MEQPLIDNKESTISSGEAAIKNNLELLRILEAAKKGIVVHGETVKKEGKESLHLKTDLDGRAALYLIELAGIEYPQLTFVKKGESKSEGLHIDTGGRPVFVIESDGTVFFDHHGKERDPKGKSSSATKQIYEKLIEHGLLKKTPWLDSLVNFVTDIDNANYDLNKRIFENYYSKSLYGLLKVLPFETIVEYIKEGRDPKNPFTEKEIEEKYVQTVHGNIVKLSVLCQEQQNYVNRSTEGIISARKDMERIGIKIKTERLGKVLFNIIKTTTNKKGKKVTINKIPLGFTATRAVGFDSYVLWSEKDGGFFVTSKFHLGKTFEAVSKIFPEAKLIRGTMIISLGEKSGGQIQKKDEFLKALEMIV